MLTYYLAVKAGRALLLIAPDEGDARRQAAALLGEPDACTKIKLNVPVTITEEEVPCTKLS